MVLRNQECPKVLLLKVISNSNPYIFVKFIFTCKGVLEPILLVRETP